MTRPDTPFPEPGAAVVLSPAADQLGIARSTPSGGLLTFHSNGRELALNGYYMSCNSAIPSRLLKIPPYHLALLKHEGVPVALAAILESDDAIDAGAQIPAGERIGVYTRVNSHWTCLGTADSADALVARVKAARTAGAKRVSLLRFPHWRHLNVVTVHGRAASVVELDHTAAPDMAAGLLPVSGRRAGPDLLADVDPEPMARASDILGLGIGSFNVLADPGGGILITGFSDRLPWRLHCGTGDDFDPAPAVDVLRRYFELPAAASRE